MSDDYEDGLGEEERLLARRRSTSYYDANRSRAPVTVIVGHDMKGRPISTWSTASSVAAQRGEELSQWSRRRDDLIRGHRNSNSFIAQGDLDEGEEDEGQDEPERNNEQQHQNQCQDHGNHDHEGVVTKSENGLSKSHDV
ncbi:hypothetical protein BG011_010095 [Mortierella polycephala]|uniref:Uncharacterized protein n=1 Tax=Mortierella polycephala TaxID=41804 RepID=A0A9P6QB85_9FUNG|nr:hypothetical protein BG011_010095 [Mortierella polycephala]